MVILHRGNLLASQNLLQRKNKLDTILYWRFQVKALIGELYRS